jgi:carboxypeptidase C (cathepsin A)
MRRAALAIGLLIASPAAAQHRFVTDHAGSFNGRAVAYSAEVAETVLSDDKGTPTASVYTTAYLAKDAPAGRPILFAFNGGPGSPSLWLHMGALGPERVPVPADLSQPIAADTPRVANPDTVLDVADIVLIDPPGTGFSRILPGAAPRAFYSVGGDAAAVGDVIAAWLKQHKREGAPLYLLGESYGTIRVAAVTRYLARRPQPIAFSGVLLMGQALNIVETSQRPMNIVSHMVSLPTLTAIAWYHDRIPHAGRTVERAMAESEAFAQGAYLNALAKGDAISPAERDRIAKRLSALTGIDAEYFAAHGLFILKDDFRTELLKDQGLVLARYDARYATKAGADGRAADPNDAVTAAYAAQLASYLKDDLKVDLADEYRLRDPGNRGDWAYGPSTSPFSDWPFGTWLAETMRAVPDMRLLIGTGLYDTTTTTGAAGHLAAHAGFPAGRVTTRHYAGGHMAYTNPAALHQFTGDIRAFILAGRQ